MKLTNISAALAVCFFGASVAHAASNLADFHKDAGLDCQSCHAAEKIKDIKNTLTDSETHENNMCVECHGSYKDLKSDKAETYIDPHNSHLHNVNCTSCHTAHQKPELTCNRCHNFNIDMPFADSKAKKPWDGAWEQDKIKAAIVKGPVESVDVIVVGGGSAGYNAALAAKLAGASVILLEKNEYTGGNSMLAAGGYNASETKQQKEKGVPDTKELFIKDAMKGGRGQNDIELVTVLAEQSAAGIEWLESLGANMNDLKFSGGQTEMRTHRPAGGYSVGPHIIDTLDKAAKKHGVDLRVNSRVEKIVLNEDQSIAGVVVHGKHSGYRMIAANSVVLSTGGYGMNKDMVSYYRPTMAGMTSSNNITATGDGIVLAKEVGASMTDIDWVQAHPTIGKDSRILISETVRGVGAIMVNIHGERFVSEMTTRDRASDAVLKQPEQYAWLVFDQQLVPEFR
ncbi:MAG: flavocytochrome c [Shewanella sp.]